MSPVCATCGLVFRCTKNSRAIELMGYQIWFGDEFTCDGCGARIITSFGSEPVKESWQQGYTDKLATEDAQNNLVLVKG